MAISPGKTQKWLFTFSIHLAYHEFENNDEGTLYLTSPHPVSDLAIGSGQLIRKASSSRFTGIRPCDS